MNKSCESWEEIYTPSNCYLFYNRWEKMCHLQDEHPEVKPKTMGDHMKLLNKFGFEVHHKLTPEEEKIEGISGT